MLKSFLANPWIQVLGVLAAMALTYFLWLLVRPVLVSLLLAFLVAYVLDPIVDVFEARRIPRGATIAVLAVLGVLLILAIPLIVIPGVVAQAQQLADAASSVSADAGVSGWVDWLDEELPLDDLVRLLGWVDADVEEVDARALFAERISAYIQQNATQFGTTAGLVFMFLGRGTVRFILFIGNLVIFMFLAGYLLNDFDRVVAVAKALVPHTYRDRTFEIAGKIDVHLRGFLRGQVLVCVCLAALYAVGLTISGVPFAVPLALFGGFASLVPYLGVALTIGPAVLLTFLQHWIDWHIIGAVLTFVVAQGIEGTIITPKIVGDKVGLHPVWVILAIIVFGSAMGFLGMLLAVPIAATVKVFVVEVLAYYRTSAFFAGASDTAEPPEESP